MTDEVTNVEEDVATDKVIDPEKVLTPKLYSRIEDTDDDDETQPTEKEVSATVEDDQEKPSDPEEETYKKRYGDLKTHYDRELSKWRGALDKKDEELRTARPEYKPPKTAEELKEFKEQYPDLYEVVETIAHERALDQDKGLKTRLDVLQQREQKVSHRDAESRLKEAHPDLDAIRADAKFHKWAESQPQVIQDWLYNNPDDAELAIRAIDLYKRDIGLVVHKDKKTDKKTKQSDTSVAITKTKSGEVTKEPKVWRESEIAALSAREYTDSLEAEIDKALREGRVLMGE